MTTMAYKLEEKNELSKVCKMSGQMSKLWIYIRFNELKGYAKNGRRVHSFQTK